METVYPDTFTGMPYGLVNTLVNEFVNTVASGPVNANGSVTT